MSRARERVRIGIHIAVKPGTAGGVVQSTQGLVSSLGKLEGPEQYLIVAQKPDQGEWIRTYCGPNQKLVVHDAKPRSWRAARTNGNWTSHLKVAFRPPLEAIRWVTGRLTPPPPSVPISDGFYESLDCDVLHFPTQAFMVCAVPTVYNPHDLQHLHYPQFFTPTDLAWREMTYRAACHFAHTVVVGSNWIKEDVVRQYNINPGKVQIIPWASPTAQYPHISPETVQNACQRLNLPEIYALYPAVTWPHKNHLRLLEALADLRDRRGLIVNLVCTGARGVFWSKVEQAVHELNLANQVKFLGFLSELELRAVYRNAQFVVLPSLFEADSCPVHEAWSEGTPVASSNHTALPDQVGDAGLLFDAGDVSAIAVAIERMATDETLRHQLVERGHLRVKDFDWCRTAKAFRAVYRRAAGLTLNDEDRWLLTWDWMREPNRISSIAGFR